MAVDIALDGPFPSGGHVAPKAVVYAVYPVHSLGGYLMTPKAKFVPWLFGLIAIGLAFAVGFVTIPAEDPSLSVSTLFPVYILLAVSLGRVVWMKLRHFQKIEI